MRLNCWSTCPRLPWVSLGSLKMEIVCQQIVTVCDCCLQSWDVQRAGRGSAKWTLDEKSPLDFTLCMLHLRTWSLTTESTVKLSAFVILAPDRLAQSQQAIYRLCITASSRALHQSNLSSKILNTISSSNLVILCSWQCDMMSHCQFQLPSVISCICLTALMHFLWILTRLCNFVQFNKCWWCFH